MLNSFWRSADREDNVVVDVDFGTKFALQRIEVHWRSNFSAKRFTVEVSTYAVCNRHAQKCTRGPIFGQSDTQLRCASTLWTMDMKVK